MAYANVVEEWLAKYPSVQAFNKLLKRGRMTPTTVDNYVKSVKAFCDFIGYSDPETALKAIREIGEIEEWLDSLVGEIREKAGDTRCVNIMKGVKWWLDLNKVDVDWRDIILPSVEAQVEDRAPTKEELRKLLHFANIRDQALILAGASSGLRMNTLRTLTFGDVNFDYPDVARIIVKKQYKVKGETYTSGRKISKKRRLYVTFISAEAKKALLEYKQYRMDEGENVTDESPLFTSMRKDEMGQFISMRYLSTHWGRLLRKAHLDEKSGGWFVLHFHTLKKFAETQFINAGVTPSYREFWLGHKGAYLEASYFRGEEPKHLEEYRKAIPHLSVFERPSRTEEAEALARLEIALHDIPPERRKAFITTYLQNLPYSLRHTLEEGERLKNVMVSIEKEEIKAPRLERHMVVTKKVEKEENEEDCQRVILENELEDYLKKGWRFVAGLNNGKAVIEK